MNVITKRLVPIFITCCGLGYVFYPRRKYRMMFDYVDNDPCQSQITSRPSRPEPDTYCEDPYD